MGPHEEDHSTDRLLPPAGHRRLAARAVLHQHCTRPRRGRATRPEALAYHESVPGHHLQIAIAQELPGLPAFRRAPRLDGVRRGLGPVHRAAVATRWASTAATSTGSAILSFDAWRAARLVVDTGHPRAGLDARPGDRRSCSSTPPSAPNNIANEVDRYIVWPGQALAYKIGQLEILRLRDEAEARLGGRFDIRAFHDAVLGSGALALPTLRDVVEAWADRGGSPRADGRHRGRRAGTPRSRSPRGPSSASCATATSGARAGVDARHRRRLGPARRRPRSSPTTRAAPCWSGWCR